MILTLKSIREYLNVRIRYCREREGTIGSKFRDNRTAQNTQSQSGNGTRTQARTSTRLSRVTLMEGGKNVKSL